MFRLLFAVSLATLVSCTPKLSGLFDRNQGASVIGGQDVKEGAPITSSVVALLNTKEGYLCTGSLITANMVLTAAHCMPERASDVKVIFANDVDDIMGTREPDVLQAHVLPVVAFKANEKWKDGAEDQFNTSDIAIMKFKGTVPEGYKPATFLADQSVLKRGTVVTVAGYGVSVVDSIPINEPKKYRNLEEAIEAGTVVCDSPRRNCMEIQMSGDGLLRQAQAPISSVQETEVRLDERKAGTCGGDSGGPAYIEKDGQFYLFGITSRGSIFCSSTGIYTNALTFKQWIVDTINALNK